MSYRETREGPPGPVSEPPPEGPGGFPGPASALVLYVILTVVLTWPLSLHLGDRLPAGDNDLWQNYWNLWWWKTALLELHQSPYQTHLLYQPGEVALGFHTHSEGNIIQTFPVLLLAGVPAALNTALLLGFLLAAWGGYFLAREIVGSREAAFLGGIVLAFFPHHFDQSLEHLNLASYQAMPFFLFFLLRLVRRGGTWNLVLSGAFFALNCHYSWHNGLLVLPLAAAMFLVELRRCGRPRGRVILEAVIAGVVATLLVFPLFWPILREIVAGSIDYLKPHVNKGVDPLFLLVPPPEHPLWGRLVGGLYETWRTYESSGFTCYLGAAALATWLGGWVRSRRTPRVEGSGADPHPAPWAFWGIMFLLFVMLALGDPLYVAGRETGIRLPFALLRDAPLFKTIRVANRFMVPAALALSVLVALGARSILAGWKRGRLVLSGLTALVILDFLWIPYPMREIPAPPWTGAIAACPEGALLDIPGSYRGRAAEDMFLQTRHGRALLGGYTSCVPRFMTERVAEFPFLQLVLEGRPSHEVLEHAEDPLRLEADFRQVADGLPVAVVVLHLDRERERLEKLRAEHRDPDEARLYNPEKGIPRKTLARIRGVIEKLWGRPCYEDASVVVFGRPGG